MSYKGKILRGEKFAVLYTEKIMKGKGFEDILNDYEAFLESEKKVKTKSKEKK